MKRLAPVLLLTVGLAVIFRFVLATGTVVGQTDTMVAAARYVATDGWNFKVAPFLTNSCLNEAEPCLTVDWAVAQSDPGDTILVECGLYETTATTIVDKDLTISSKTTGNQCVVLSTTTGRVLDVTNNAEVTLFNLKVSGGDAGTGRGGGIRVVSGAGLTINGVTVNNNAARAGGGIYAPGDLVVLNSFVRDNSATERGGGLRIRDTGSLVLDNSEVVNNSADRGGGIFTDGPTDIRNDSFVSFNDASTNGGGIISSGLINITDSTVSENSAAGEGGGMRVRAASSLTVDASVIRDNDAEEGGGLYVEGTALITGGAHISGNNSDYGGGALLFTSSALTLERSSVSGNASNFGGGGIFNGGTLTILNSSVHENVTNTWGGGIYNKFGSMSARNSTFSGNAAIPDPALSVDATGGAILSNAPITLTNVTIAHNSAEYGGGIYNGDSAFAVVGNLLLSLNQPDDCLTAPGATFFVGLANLDSDGSCPDFLTGAAMLALLADNGGPTLTHMPGSGGKAVDAGNNSACAAVGNVDQRGYSRTNVDGNGDASDGDACDIGAVERNGQPPVSLDEEIYLPLQVNGR